MRVPSKLKSKYTSRAGLRASTLIALFAYPLGCVALLLLPDGLDTLGGALIFLAALAFAHTLPSYIGRIAYSRQVLGRMGDDYQLDEVELDVRRRATSFAYHVFCALVLVGIGYMIVASDMINAGKADLWVPRIDDHWIAIALGALLYALLLPVAYLAWTMPEPSDEEHGDHEGVSPTSGGALKLESATMTLGMGIGLVFGVAFFGDAWLGMAIGFGVGLLLELIRSRARN